MKRFIKCALCVLFCATMCIGSLWYINEVMLLKRYDGVTPMRNFYRQENDTVDVLLIGSSHTGFNIDTGILWDEYGMASYSLWGSAQPFWNSYHFLIEALKTQHPKVVVLETLAADQSTLSFEYQDEARQLTNIAGMKPSLNKWNAVKVTAPKERWFDLFFGLPLYHQRYSEITQNDYAHFPWVKTLVSEKGGAQLYGTQNTVEVVDVSDIDTVKELIEKEETYLRKIISLCQEKELPLILVTTPKSKRSAVNGQPYYNRVAQIAEEYGVPYYNLSLLHEAFGLASSDFAKDNGHLNVSGARKVASYLGGLIKSQYDVPDRRGDPRFSSWEDNAAKLRQAYMTKVTQADEYAAELVSQDWALFAVSRGHLDETAQAFMSALRLTDLPTDRMSAWSIPSTKTGAWSEVPVEDESFEGSIGASTIVAKVDPKVWIDVNDATVCAGLDSNIVLVVLDVNTNECVDVILPPYTGGADLIRHVME